MEKYCPHCKTALPLTNFNKNACRSDGLEAQCRDCRKAMRGNATSQKPVAWSDAEDEVIWTHYPNGGSPACVSRLPGRSLAAIYQRAHRLGVKPREEEQWGTIPQQDSAADHLLFQRTPMPVFARGNLSPRLAA